MKSFGIRLKELRESRKLSQHELAEMANVGVMLVNRYERGINLPSIETLVRLAQVFDMTTDELLGTTTNATARKPEIRNLRLYEKFRLADELPKDEQEVVLRLVEAFVTQSRAKAFAENVGGKR